MKKQHNRSFLHLCLIVLGGIALFGLFAVLASSCTKLPKPLDLGSISGRWAQVADTTAHFYIDSATTATAVLRYPTRIHAPLGTYSRHQYSLATLSRSVELTAGMLPGRYTLYQVGGKWRGIVYHTVEGNTVPVDIIQLDNNRSQPGPDAVTPL